jgi:hypothetical protein
MSDQIPQRPTDPAAVLRAALAAKREAAARAGPPGKGHGRRSERDAAALSASKSKPAMRR